MPSKLLHASYKKMAKHIERCLPLHVYIYNCQCEPYGNSSLFGLHRFRLNSSCVLIILKAYVTTILQTGIRDKIKYIIFVRLIR